MTARVILVDNYDSFVGSIYQYLGVLGAEVTVIRNDALTVPEARDLSPSHLVISPGPKRPEHAGISLELIRTFAGQIPILGVCLGHQAIGQAFGGRVVAAKSLVHGKTSPVTHDGRGIFAGLPSPLVATRYHSLALDRDSLPEVFEIAAETADREIMAIRHRELESPLIGLQFHPESVLTAHGHELIRNFLGGTVRGLFETVLVRDGRAVRLDRHLERLRRSAARLGLAFRDDPAEVRRRLEGLRDGRLTLTLAGGRVRVEVRSFPGYDEQLYRDGAIALLAGRPGHPLGDRAGHKSLPYDVMLAAREEARRRGAIEMLFTDGDGALLEGSVSNLFIVRGSDLVTPPLTRPILPGVTRAAVLALAPDLGLTAREEDLRPADLAGADEVFLTSSLMLALPLHRVGEIELAPGPVAGKLRNLLA